MFFASFLICCVTLVFVALTLWPLVREALDLIGWRVFREAVRAQWRLDVADEDIIDTTGEAVWLEAYRAGMSPREAVVGVEF